MHKYFFLLVIFSRMICNGGSDEVIDLLSDPALSQFEKKGGNASYILEDGILTGVAAWDTPNTFLCTKEKYKDFILDFAVKIDPRLNSGVQIRSKPFIDNENYEMLRGYQVEIDPSDRAWSGGIYEEQGRGWIGNLCANPAGRAAFKNGEWNYYHVEVIGNSIKVWVNEINTVNLLDDQGVEGVIGLQVHAIYEEEHIGTEVQWKEISLITKNLMNFKKLDHNLAPEINLLPNELSEAEQEAAWELIDRDNIKTPPPGFDLKPWNLTAEKFCSFKDTYDYLGLMTVKGDFEIKFEYQIDQGGTAEFSYGYVGADYTYVLADDSNLSDDIPANQKAGSILNLTEAQNLSNPERDKELRAHDQWSQVHLIVEGNNIKHWLNNSLVVDLTIDNFQVPGKERLLKFVSNEVQLCVRSIKFKKLTS